MKVIVLDTETTSLDKPFCYNLGYAVFDTDSHEIEMKREYVIEQIWHNLPLFESAYYADKRPIYIKRMQSRKVEMTKWGYAMGQLRRDIKNFGIEAIYAYNSSFDERVINYNCDWFKTLNPLDEIKMYDIWAMAQHFIVDDEYKQFCEENEYFTDTGNYKTSAEVVARYLFDRNFEEEHTALSDSIIETAILDECLMRKAELKIEYELKRSIPRPIKKHSTIMVDNEVVAEIDFTKSWKKSDMSVIKFTS